MVVIEREAELVELDALITRAREGAGAIALLEGPAGIGKTALLRAVVTRAREQCLVAVEACGDHLERDFPFAVVRGLFENTLVAAGAQRQAELLGGAAGLAAPALGLQGAREEPELTGGRLLASLHGLYWLSANLAAEGPLVIVVDDAHWADAASLRWLVYLARRLAELPILLVLSIRSGETDAGTQLLAAIADQPHVSTIRPAALTEAGTGRLISEAVGQKAEPPFAASAHEATAGNPFLLHQLVAVLAAEGIAPRADAAAQVYTLAPDTVARSITVRLSRLPSAAAAIAHAVAVLGNRVQLSVAAALAGYDIVAAGEAADALARVQILAAARPLKFVHPIVQQAVYEDMGAARRARGHAAAANLLRAAGAEPGRIAAHLLATEPSASQWATEVLRAATRDARDRGAPEAAASFVRRALDEPPPAEMHADVLFELGVAETAAGEPQLAVEHLLAAFAARDEPRFRAHVVLALGEALLSTGRAREGVALFDAVTERLGPKDRELRWQLEAHLIAVTRIELSARLVVRDRISLDASELEAGQLRNKAVLSNLAVETCFAGEPATRAVELAHRALHADRSSVGAGADARIMDLAAVRVLSLTDRFDAADSFFADVVARARRRGEPMLVATVSALRSELLFRRGALADAETEARIALSFAADIEWPVSLHGATAFLINVLLERGELDEADETLTRSGLQGDVPLLLTTGLLLDSRGRLRVALGRTADGLTDILECGRCTEAWGDRATVPWRSSAAVVLARLGRTQEASRIIGEQIDVARRFGTLRSIGVALRDRALVERGQQAIATLHEAVAVLATSGAQLEHARTLTDYGAAVRRSGRRTAARDPLRQGLHLAHRCGSTVLEVRAREELVLAGARPRRPSISGLASLTPSERRIAAMASAGASNRDIAQALCVTVRTVETHLTHAYTKLDIRSREGLSAALGDRGRVIHSVPIV